MNAIDPGFEELLAFVRDSRAFDYTGYRRPTLMRRFQKRMQEVGSSTWAEYREFLDKNPDEFAELFDAILINVTGFFRDKETWELVEREIVPAIADQKDGRAPVRVWSAGCASGEEAYTIMLILAEVLGEETLKTRVKIYATDIDDDALHQAREATFTRKQLEPVPPALRERYFVQANGSFMVRKELRRSVIFGRNDLHRDPRYALHAWPAPFPDDGFDDTEWYAEGRAKAVTEPRTHQRVANIVGESSLAGEVFELVLDRVLYKHRVDNKIEYQRWPDRGSGSISSEMR